MRGAGQKAGFLLPIDGAHGACYTVENTVITVSREIMAKGQVSISTTGKMAEVLADALDIFPDAQTEAQALTRALFHWHHGRQENSKRGALARLETEMSELKLQVARQGHILQMICEKLDIDLEAIDTDA